MQSLSASLLAAQAKQDVAPYVALTIGDVPPETPRLSELASQYAGAEPDSSFDASWTSDGKIVRCRQTGGAFFAQVVDPNSPTWSTWTTLDPAGSGSLVGGNQCCCRGNIGAAGDARAYEVLTNGTTVKVWNYTKLTGLWTTGGVVVNVAPGSTVAGLACCANDPTERIFYVLSFDHLYETHLSGGLWTTPVSDGRAWGTPTLSASYRAVSAPGGDGDAWIVIAATPSLQPTQLAVVQFKITSGSGWGTPLAILQTGVSSGYSYAYPHFTESRSDSLRACLTWSEIAPAPIGTLPMICFTPSHTRITGVLPWRFGGSSAFGVKVFRDQAGTPSWWIVTSNQVYKVLADTLSGTGMRLAIAPSDVVDVDLRWPGPNRPATGRVTVLNTNGVYKDAGVVGTVHQCLRAWSQVAVQLGYWSPGVGHEQAFLPALWIEGITFHDDVKTGTPLMTLHLVDSWGVLERLRFRSTVTLPWADAGMALRPDPVARVRGFSGERERPARGVDAGHFYGTRRREFSRGGPAAARPRGGDAGLSAARGRGWDWASFDRGDRDQSGELGVGVQLWCSRPASDSAE